MASRGQAVFTQQNNVIGTLNLLFAVKKYSPNLHIIKLGTMGVYGTPNIDIEEGYLKINHKKRNDVVLFPFKPHSYYHLSKAHDSLNLAFASRVWGLRVTDLNQGIVYGTDTSETENLEELNTSFHYDHLFGTVLNRFCVQAVLGVPLSVYGNGLQIRTFLNIRDTLKCINLAIKNPPKKNQYLVRNQFTEIFNIKKLAELVKKSANKIGYNTKINYLKNPRYEMTKHYYNPQNKSFLKLGLKPMKLDNNFIISVLNKIEKHKHRINVNTIDPKVKWDQKK